jgi:hypothetical protein
MLKAWILAVLQALMPKKLGVWLNELLSTGYFSFIAVFIRLLH